MRSVPRVVFLLSVVFLLLTTIIGCRGVHYGRHTHAHRHDRHSWAHGGVHAAPRAERRSLRDGPLALYPQPALRQSGSGTRSIRTPQAPGLLPRSRKACCNSMRY